MLSEAMNLPPEPTGLAAAASPGAVAAVVDTPAPEKPGDRISHYKLLQPIGEGGMGIVYMAEQEEPIRRRVALKVIKLGMDTKSVIARFEAERQALALMDHPNIAKVLDAGATAAGRPFFVMELVRGIRITDFCDQNHFNPHQRLDLFTRVCKAIQHAHQKGIIHRDIKPSNILVTLHDGVPVPKIIDFGVAKATRHQRLTDGARLTTFEQFIGTPAYMSPEQAELSWFDLDTRSDIYSLGVLLYELLTGLTPFDDCDLSQAGLDEMRRKIREDEPRKPSTRLSSMGPADAVDLTQRFQLPPPKLAAVVRGDLDWIVMKCLEKDRSRRYHTANGLAMDIQRYLDNEPVLARPPSAAYRFQKLVRRNRITFGTVSAVAAALIFGFVVSTWMFFKERAAVKRSQTVARLLEGMLKDLNPAIAPGSHAKILHEILDKNVERIATELSTQPEIEAEMWSLIGNAYYELDDYSKAAERYGEALRLRETMFGARHSLVAASLNDLGNALEKQELRRPEAETLKRRALAIRQSLFGKESAEAANSLTSLAKNLTYQKKLSEAETLQRTALAVQRKLPGDAYPDVFVSLNNLARLLRAGNKCGEAEQAYYDALATARDHPNLAMSDTLTRLANLLLEDGKLSEAELAGRQALELRRKLLDHDHELVSESFHFLVGLLQRQGKSEDVENLFRERLQAMRSDLPTKEPEFINTLVRFIAALIDAKKYAEAEPSAREALTLREKQMPGDWRIFISRSMLGTCLLGQKKFEEAERWLLSGYEGLKQREATIPDIGKPYLKDAHQRLVDLYTATNRPDKAAELRQQAP